MAKPVSINAATDIMLSKVMQDLARILDESFREIVGEDIGFMLMTFPTEDTQRANYVSNCDRAEVQAALEELLKLWKEGMPDIPAHKVS